MFEWMKSSSEKIQNPEQLSQAVLDLLHKEFERTEDPKLAQALLRYVVDGEGADVLLQLKGVPDIAKKLQVVKTHSYSPERRRSHQRINILIKTEVPATVIFRLVQVVHAAFETSGLPLQWQHLPAEHAWVETLFAEYKGHSPREHKEHTHVSLEVNFVLAILMVGGCPDTLLAELIFLEKPQYSYSYFDQNHFFLIKDIRTYLSNQSEVLQHVLNNPDISHRIHVMEMLSQHNITPKEPALSKILALGLSSAKRERAAAQKVFTRMADPLKDWLVPQLERLVSEGKASEQFHALTWLWQVQGHACVPLLNQCLEKTSSKKVRLEIEKFLQMSQPAESADQESQLAEQFSIPEVKTYSSDYQVPAGIEAEFRAALERYNQRAIDAHAKAWDRTDPKWRRGERELDPPLNPTRIDLLISHVVSAKVALHERSSAKMNLNYEYRHLLHQELMELARAQGLDP